MPIIEYPFYCIAPGHPPRPMLPIQIINPATNQFFNTWGQIDTGADECALPAQLAGILGHNLQAGDTKNVATGNGVTTSYSHTTRINIYRMYEETPNNHKVDTSTVVYTIPETPIDFMPNLGTILLGVKNFLSRFVLTIDYTQNKFSIKNPS